MTAFLIGSAACSKSHGRVAAADAGQHEAQAQQEAEQIADDLELAFERYRSCRGLSADQDVWDGFSRECFVALIVERLKREDALCGCVRETIASYAACGAQTPCDRQPCISAVLLDDDPVRELFTEDCRGVLDPDARAQLACK